MPNLKIQITDVGQYTVEGSDQGLLETRGDNSYSGATLTKGTAGDPITLNVSHFEYGFDVMTDNDSSPSSSRGLSTDVNFEKREWQSGSVGQTGVNVPRITLRGRFNISNELEAQKIGKLNLLSRTRGIKKLSSQTDASKTAPGTKGHNPTQYFSFPVLSYLDYDNPDPDSADHDNPTYKETITEIYARIEEFTVKISGVSPEKLSWELVLSRVQKEYE